MKPQKDKEKWFKKISYSKLYFLFMFILIEITPFSILFASWNIDLFFKSFLLFTALFGLTVILMKLPTFSLKDTSKRSVGKHLMKIFIYEIMAYLLLIFILDSIEIRLPTFGSLGYFKMGSFSLIVFGLFIRKFRKGQINAITFTLFAALIFFYIGLLVTLGEILPREVTQLEIVVVSSGTIIGCTNLFFATGFLLYELSNLARKIK